MANYGEIESAIDVLEDAGTHRSYLITLRLNTLLHSGSNLYAMNSIAQSFGMNVGYSDHTQESL